MKLVTPEISWHTKEPVYSVDFQRNGPNWRFATAGADNDVRIWSLTFNAEKANISYMATLSRHSKAVNVVRFSPDGELLASSGDDNAILLWKLSDSLAPAVGEEEGNKETWTVVKMLRGHLEDIYDLCWSCDSKYMVSGSVDNKTIIWDIQKGQHVCILGESKQYVQGVAWDPQGQWVVTHSNDRNMRIYSVLQKFKCTNTVNKLLLPGENAKQAKMFLDESASSFFRRLAFTPDGSLLIVPAGCIEVEDKLLNVTYIFSRNNLTKPALYLPAQDKPTVIVRCCPVYFELRPSPQDQSHPPLFGLPYRMVYAVASVDSVMIYDTQSPVPFAYITNAHYAGITDMAWTNDGLALVISSSDGYCSIVTFSPGEIGTPLSNEAIPCIPNVSSELLVTPVSNKKGASEGRIKPRKICLAPASTISAGEATPTHVGPEAGAEVKCGESTMCEGKSPNNTKSAPNTTPDLKPRRVAFLTLSKGTENSHLEAKSSPDSSVPSTSPAVKPMDTGTTSSSGSVVTPTTTIVSSSKTGLMVPRRVDLVTLSSASDRQLTPHRTLDVTPPVATGVNPRRINFVTLSKNSPKRPSVETKSSGEITGAETSNDADSTSNESVSDQVEPMDVQAIP